MPACSVQSSWAWLVADEIVVVINTGSGLKDIKAATQITAGMRVIPPTLAAVKEALDPALTLDAL